MHKQRSWWCGQAGMMASCAQDPSGAVFILTDDPGHMDAGTGNPEAFHKTFAQDRLKRESMVVTQTCASAPAGSSPTGPRTTAFFGAPPPEAIVLHGRPARLQRDPWTQHPITQALLPTPAGGTRALKDFGPYAGSTGTVASMVRNTISRPATMVTSKTAAERTSAHATGSQDRFVCRRHKRRPWAGMGCRSTTGEGRIPSMRARYGFKV